MRVLPVLLTLPSAFVLAACAPPPAPVTTIVSVDAATEHWQTQPVGTSPGAAIRIRRGDAVTIAATGEITYIRRVLGSRKAGPTGAADPAPRGYCPDAPSGALLWRIGFADGTPDADGTCHALATPTVTVVADREGILQFMVNDEAGRYGDNSGAFRVQVTVVAR